MFLARGTLRSCQWSRECSRPGRHRDEIVAGHGVAAAAAGRTSRCSWRSTCPSCLFLRSCLCGTCLKYPPPFPEGLRGVPPPSWHRAGCGRMPPIRPLRLPSASCLQDRLELDSPGRCIVHAPAVVMVGLTPVVFLPAVTRSPPVQSKAWTFSWRCYTTWRCHGSSSDLLISLS